MMLTRLSSSRIRSMNWAAISFFSSKLAASKSSRFPGMQDGALWASNASRSLCSLSICLEMYTAETSLLSARAAQFSVPQPKAPVILPGCQDRYSPAGRRSAVPAAGPRPAAPAPAGQHGWKRHSLPCWSAPNRSGKTAFPACCS